MTGKSKRGLDKRHAPGLGDPVLAVFGSLGFADLGDRVAVRILCRNNARDFRRGSP